MRLVTRHALLTYSRKHWPGWQSRILSGIVWAEAGVRQVLSAWRGRTADAVCYRELRNLVRDHSCGRADAVAGRIRFAAGFLDPIAAAQDGRTA
jgi:hypothetical protein